MKLVAIDWVDCHTESDWAPIEDAKRIAADKNSLVMHTVGFLVADEEEYVLIAASYSPNPKDDLVGNTTQIPRSAIVKQQKLKRK